MSSYYTVTPSLCHWIWTTYGQVIKVPSCSTLAALACNSLSLSLKSVHNYEHDAYLEEQCSMPCASECMSRSEFVPIILTSLVLHMRTCTRNANHTAQLDDENIELFIAC